MLSKHKNNWHVARKHTALAWLLALSLACAACTGESASDGASPTTSVEGQEALFDTCGLAQFNGTNGFEIPKALGLGSEAWKNHCAGDFENGRFDHAQFAQTPACYHAAHCQEAFYQGLNYGHLFEFTFYTTQHDDNYWQAGADNSDGVCVPADVRSPQAGQVVGTGTPVYARSYQCFQNPTIGNVIAASAVAVPLGIFVLKAGVVKYTVGAGAEAVIKSYFSRAAMFSALNAASSTVVRTAVGVAIYKGSLWLTKSDEVVNAISTIASDIVLAKLQVTTGNVSHDAVYRLRQSLANLDQIRKSIVFSGATQLIAERLKEILNSLYVFGDSVNVDLVNKGY